VITKELEITISGDKKHYDAVLFDLGKVLIPFDFAHAYGRMAKRCGLTVETVRTRLGATRLFRDFESGVMESKIFAHAVGRELGFRGNYDEFCEIWTSIFLPEPLLPESLVTELRKRYRTLIVSNTNEIHFEMLLRTYPILKHFDGYVLSYLVNAMKPAAAFYQAAIASAGCAPERCLFIDDLAENVDGARAAGMDGIHFLGRIELEEELMARGLLVPGIGSADQRTS
jgi:FMN phosphatase YigB (HAD superfamily)